jgi:hypothetical protein
LEAVAQQFHQFDAVKFADVFERLGEPGVDVVALDAVAGRSAGGGLGRLASVAAKTLQHELEHVALPVQGWGSMGKDE